MKTLLKPIRQAIIKAIAEDKELTKNINKVGHYSVDDFIDDAIRYIEAIETGRMLCVIKSVSASGMSRLMKFNSCQKHTKENRYSYRQYWCLFIALGWSPVREKDAFRISGCGMDMVFHVNYNNMHTFHRLGFMTRKECDSLAQSTPTVL